MSFENKHNSVDIALDDVNELFFETAKLSLKKKQVKKSTKRKNNKRWYDRSLQELCMAVDHYSRILSFNPYNRNRRYFVIKLHTWFCLSYFLKTNIKFYCIYQYFMSINSFFNTVSVSRYSRNFNS